MLLGRNDLAHNDTSETAALRFDRVDFVSGHGEPMRQCIGIKWGIDPLA